MIDTEVRKQTGLFRFYNSRGTLVRSAKHLNKHEVKQVLELTGAVSCVHWVRPNVVPKVYALFEDQLVLVALTQIQWDRYMP